MGAIRSAGVLRNALVFAVAMVPAVVSAVVVAPGRAARPALYWTSAPPAGAHVLLDHVAPTLRVAAAAADRRAHVGFSLLGRTAVRIVARPGNPAIATLRFPSMRDFSPHTFVVTVVAHTTGRHRIAIERTVVVSVRARSVSLSAPGPVTHWTYVLHSTEARRSPSQRAAAVDRVPRVTSDSMPNLVRALAEERSPSGGAWVKVALTTLPNGRTGWVPRSALSIYHAVRTRLVIDTRRLTISLFRRGKRVFSAPIGVGTAQWPTPHGTFYVRERLTNFHDAVYGPIAFGTSARSATLTDWPGGGIVGIHGTNQPELVPGRISHGCVRLRNVDILRLARLLPVGTPIEIR